MRMPTISRRQALAYGVVLLALLALVGRSLVAGSDTRAEAGADPGEAATVVVAGGPEDERPGSLLVHVAGAVRYPGVYELDAGSRVADAVERAGGPRARAALQSINLAAELLDGQQVVVPLREPPGGAVSGGLDATPQASASGSSDAGGPISLSTATAAQLEELPGVGPVTAERIIAHRDEHGPFRAIDELAAVSGIGAARIEAIRDLVTP